MAARLRAKEFVMLNIMSDLMAGVHSCARRRARLCHRCICQITKRGNLCAGRCRLDESFNGVFTGSGVLKSLFSSGNLEMCQSFPKN